MRTPWRKHFVATYSQAKRQANLTFDFKSLEQIKGELRHSRIDILKMDIEGFEWRVLQSLLELSDRDLPTQILFELHTEGASPTYVPPSLVRGQTRREVVQLFLNLFDRGYRVVFKQLNVGDHRCADFTLINVQRTNP